MKCVTHWKCALCKFPCELYTYYDDRWATQGVTPITCPSTGYGPEWELVE